MRSFLGIFFLSTLAKTTTTLMLIMTTNISTLQPVSAFQTTPSIRRSNGKLQEQELEQPFQQHERRASFPLYADPNDSDIKETETFETKQRPANIPPPRRPLNNNGNNNNNNNNNDPAFLSQDSNGFTVKQRLREEVESPFRKVRLVFFGSSAGSALTALYFSLLSTIKAYQGGYSDAPPLDEALTNDAINIGAAIICALLALREYRVGEANLERIQQGGRLASLPIQLVVDSSRKTLKDYRRYARVVLCAGNEEYIQTVARTLTADQLADTNDLADRLQDCDILVVPILLKSTTTTTSTPTESPNVVVGNALTTWMETQAKDENIDRNMDLNRAKNILAFPIVPRLWQEYLTSEIATAIGQGYDVMDKGITIIVKKNGRILRRATGTPPWADLIATMEVADGSRFGMPGDTEKYGGP